MSEIQQQDDLEVADLVSMNIEGITICDTTGFPPLGMDYVEQRFSISTRDILLGVVPQVLALKADAFPDTPNEKLYASCSLVDGVSTGKMVRGQFELTIYMWKKEQPHVQWPMSR